MPTAREEILTALKASGWTVPEQTDTATLIAGWRNLRVIIQFDSRDTIRGAAIKQYLPFNQGPALIPFTKDRRRQVLAFIRGELRAK
jgi:hypothetical protein